MRKFHNSQTARLIHLIPANDYLGIVRTLLTPSELFDYLEFREHLFRKHSLQIEAEPEPALAGQYVAGNGDSSPSTEFAGYLRALQQEIAEWDLSCIINKFPDRVTTNNQPTDYYSIVREIAKLNRNDLHQFKTRFRLSMGKCGSGEYVRPYRMMTPRTGCAFVFIPLIDEFVRARRRGLENLTYACKYDLRAEKCVGISFAPDEDDWYAVEWCYMDFAWQYDQELDQRLRENNPFREVKVRRAERYIFRPDD